MSDWDEQRITKAVEVPIESLPDDCQFFWNDAYFPMEAIDSVFGGEPPEFVFVCEKTVFKIDIDFVIRYVAETSHDCCEDYDIVEHLVDRDELEAFIDKWNAKQTAATWFPDFKRKVRVPE